MPNFQPEDTRMLPWIPKAAKGFIRLWFFLTCVWGLVLKMFLGIDLTGHVMDVLLFPPFVIVGFIAGLFWVVGGFLPDKKPSS